MPAPPANPRKLTAGAIVPGAAGGAPSNPAGYLGAVFMRDAFGGTVSWGQLPAYPIGEIAGGLPGGAACAGAARVRAGAALTSLTPGVPGEEQPVPEQRVSGATS